MNVKVATIAAANGFPLLYFCISTVKKIPSIRLDKLMPEILCIAPSVFFFGP
jgi:hypothetical protein